MLKKSKDLYNSIGRLLTSLMTLKVILLKQVILSNGNQTQVYWHKESNEILNYYCNSHINAMKL